MIATLSLYILLWVTITYLIYRYGRYSDWASHPVGRAFMMTKVSLWLLTTYALLAYAGLDGTTQSVVRFVTVVTIEAALLRMVHLVVRLQGGWRLEARRAVEAEMKVGRAERRRLRALRNTELQAAKRQ